jgi:SAM-dependent methyltransferase
MARSSSAQQAQRAASKAERPGIDFDREHARGAGAYDGVMGEWWMERTATLSHKRAYRKISEVVRSMAPAEPRLITDYSCGGGDLLVHMADRFPHARLRGIDASAKMLARAIGQVGGADGRLERPIEFIRSRLPDPRLPAHTEDLVVYTFPDLARNDKPRIPANDRRVGRALSKMEDKDLEDPPEEEEEPQDVFEDLAWGRAVSINLRHLVRRGGTVVRVDYADCEIEQMTKVSRMRSAFEEGSLNRAVTGVRSTTLFELGRSQFFRSKVCEDVFHQTGVEDDKRGGFLVTELRAA